MLRLKGEITPELSDVCSNLTKLSVKHLGRGPEYVDCAGIPVLAFRSRGVHIEAPTNYPLLWFQRAPTMIVDFLRATRWQRVPVANPWTVLLFGLFTNCGDHLGVYVGGRRVLHAYNERVHVSSLDEYAGRYRWSERLIAAYSPPEDRRCQPQSRSSPVQPSGQEPPTSAPSSPAPPSPRP